MVDTGGDVGRDEGDFWGLSGWFETEVTILDDTAGIVGRGSVTFW